MTMTTPCAVRTERPVRPELLIAEQWATIQYYAYKLSNARGKIKTTDIVREWADRMIHAANVIDELNGKGTTA